MKLRFTLVIGLVCLTLGGWLWKSKTSIPQPSPLEYSQEHSTEPSFNKDLSRTARLPAGKHGIEISVDSKGEITQKVELLTEILDSKNDNDPRLDQEFNSLSFETKRAFEQKYFELGPEKRNERGTIVFLLGKNLETKEDFAFLKKVIQEPACLSLQDCKIPSQKHEDSHSELGMGITLDYPQIVALKSIEALFERDPSSPLGQKIVQKALESKSATIRGMAENLAQKYSVPKS